MQENQIPMFGICLGMQMAVVEYARHCAGLPDANSSEFLPEGTQNVIDIMEDQKDITNLGGTMRLGLYPCKLTDGAKVRSIYGEELIYERHRHRFELNNAFRRQLTESGLQLAGISPDGKLVEIVELPSHPWFIGVQFHPELSPVRTSRTSCLPRLSQQLCSKSGRQKLNDNFAKAAISLQQRQNRCAAILCKIKTVRFSGGFCVETERRQDTNVSFAGSR